MGDYGRGGVRMGEFPAGGNPYKRFAHFVRYTSRHVLDEANQDFLRVVVETSRSRKRSMRTGTRLWRAQIGHLPCKCPLTDEDGKNIGLFDHVCPFPPERMKPLSECAYEGRVNAKGISCLYLSNDMKTAMSEVRPWIGSYISVGEFEIGRDLVLVDCCVDRKPPLLTTPEGTPPERERLDLAAAELLERRLYRLDKLAFTFADWTWKDAPTVKPMDSAPKGEPEA
jgi:hypothetical protein